MIPAPYGEEYPPEKPPSYRPKAKGAQEAHERRRRADGRQQHLAELQFVQHAMQRIAQDAGELL